jgi:hypothetical protein
MQSSFVLSSEPFLELTAQQNLGVAFVNKQDLGKVPRPRRTSSTVAQFKQIYGQ